MEQLFLFVVGFAHREQRATLIFPSQQRVAARVGDVPSANCALGHILQIHHQEHRIGPASVGFLFVALGLLGLVRRLS